MTDLIASLRERVEELEAERDSLRADAERFAYCLSDPEGARHLLRLLGEGKGDKASFCSMVDRIIRFRDAALAAQERKL